MVGSGAGEGNGAQRMDKAQQGMAEPSWPRSPDQRLSPLSGKMKSTLEITPKDFGKSKNFPARQAGHWQKESSLISKPKWPSNQAQGWEHARWNQAGISKDNEKTSAKFPNPQEPLAADRIQVRQIKAESGPEWLDRTSRMTTADRGEPRPYEGRLTRVREQVWRETQDARDLGKGRQERFKPEEVEKILAQPAGKFGDEVRE